MDVRPDTLHIRTFRRDLTGPWTLKLMFALWTTPTSEQLSEAPEAGHGTSLRFAGLVRLRIQVMGDKPLRVWGVFQFEIQSAKPMWICIPSV